MSQKASRAGSRKHKNIVTPDFVDASYKMLNKYKFVKAIDFYFGPYFTDETIEAIRNNSLNIQKITLS